LVLSLSGDKLEFLSVCAFKQHLKPLREQRSIWLSLRTMTNHHHNQQFLAARETPQLPLPIKRHENLDFKRIVTSARNGVCILADKTHIIPFLERQFQRSKVLTFLRPSRMGKSTFLSMLECYYSDLFKDYGSDWFKGLRIEEEQYANQLWFKRNSFKVLTMNWNLSAEGSQEDFESFILEQLRQHAKENEIPLSLIDGHSATNALTKILYHYGSEQQRVLILIDEVDFSFSSYLNNRLCGGTSMPTPAFEKYLQPLLVALKNAVSRYSDFYVLATGITPLFSKQLSVLNFKEDLTFHPAVWDIAGLTQQDVGKYVDLIFSDGDDEELKSQVLTMIGRYCNGYQFSPSCLSTSNGGIDIYNTQLVFKAMNCLQYLDKGLLRKFLKKPDHEIIPFFQDPEQDLSNSQLAIAIDLVGPSVLLDILHYMDTGTDFEVGTGLANIGSPDDILRAVSVEDRAQKIVALLYYYGVFAKSPNNDSLKCPNRVRIVNQLYIADIIKRIQYRSINLDASIQNFQTNPSCDTFAELLNAFNVLVEPRNGQIVFHNTFGEVDLVAQLSALFRYHLGKAGSHVGWEVPLGSIGKGSSRSDLVIELKTFDRTKQSWIKTETHIYEFKRIRPNAIVLPGDVGQFSPNVNQPRKWYIDRSNFVEALSISECLGLKIYDNMRHFYMPKATGDVVTVKDILDGAKRQVATYCQTARGCNMYPNTNIRGFAVIQVGTRYLVEEVDELQT
jgi:hypothetical protein